VLMEHRTQDTNPVKSSWLYQLVQAVGRRDERRAEVWVTEPAARVGIITSSKNYQISSSRNKFVCDFLLDWRLGACPHTGRLKMIQSLHNRMFQILCSRCCSMYAYKQQRSYMF
jgi:hypothetical protein